MAARRTSREQPQQPGERVRRRASRPSVAGPGPDAASPSAPTSGSSAGASPASTGGAAPLELDALIHERARLGIVSALAASQSLTFNDLKGLLGITDGNLSVHARRLEEAGYISCTKSFDGRLPRTEYRLTAKGRGALERYLDQMEALIRQTRSS